MEAVEERQAGLTALERKWMEEQEHKGPTVDDVFTDEGKLDEEKLNGGIRDRLAYFSFALSRCQNDQGWHCHS